MKTAFARFRELVEQNLTVEAIDEFYADDIEQVENHGEAIKGKAKLRAHEVKNLAGVNSLSTQFNNVVMDEKRGVVMGEMLIHFDSKKDGKKRLEEAFLQHWKNNQITYVRYYYGGILDDKSE